MGAVKDDDGWSGRKGRAYHHGRLREALLDAGRTLISERGPAGFTLAEAAKMVGVTGAAPYRHFADRRALIAALAQEGFEQFNEKLGAAWDGGKPNALVALRRRGEAYLAFVREEPGLYKAMFGDAGFLRELEADTPAQKGFDELVETTAEVLRSCNAPVDDAARLAVQIWATTHGVADLMLSGHFHVENGEAGFCVQGGEAMAVLDQAVFALIEGAVRRALGVQPGPPG